MRLLIILFAICYYSVANPIDNVKLHAEEERLVRYFTLMKAQTDSNADPCDNFYKFACGQIHDFQLRKNLIERKGASRIFYSQVNNIDLLKETFANMEPSTRAEKVAKHYYESCIELENIGNGKQMFEQLDSMKAMGSYPVKSEPTDKELIDLMTDLLLVGRFDFFMATPVGLAEVQNLSLKQKNGIALHVMRDVFVQNTSNLLAQMTEFNPPGKENELTVKQIKELYSKLNEASKIRENVVVEVGSVEKLKEMAPDFDWDMFIESLKSKINIPAEMLENFVVQDPDLFKRVATILKNTDKKIVANLLLSKAADVSNVLDCGTLMLYFQPILYKKLLNQYVDEENIAKHMVVLSDLKTSLSAMKSALKKPEDAAVDKFLGRIENLLTNHSVIFNDEYLENYYKDYILEKNMVYLNSWKFTRNLLERMLTKMHNTKFVIDLDAEITMGLLDKLFNLNTQDMPIISYLITVTPHLWEKFFEEHPQYEISTGETCLKQQGMEMEDYEMEKYLKSYAVNKVAYSDFMLKLSYVGSIEVAAKYFKNFDFKDFERAYFIGTAQDRCQYGETADGLLMKTFQHMEEFQEAFSCPADSAMNKLDEMKCDLENCDGFKEDSLHIVPYTNEKCIKTVSLNTILNPKSNL